MTGESRKGEYKAKKAGKLIDRLNDIWYINKRATNAKSELFRSNAKDGAVVQLVRTPACHAGGRGFKSLPRRHVGCNRASCADIAQLVERILGKDEVPGPNPGISSKENDPQPRRLRIFLYIRAYGSVFPAAQ